MNTLAAQGAVAALSMLVELERRAREAATVEELQFVAVNETHRLAPYRQAVLWRAGVVAVSGVSSPERGAPFTQWLVRVCRRLGKGQADIGPADRALLDARDRQDWDDWLPAAVLWVPFAAGRGGDRAALLLARDEDWHDGEIALLAELGHAYGHALGGFIKPSVWGRIKGRSGRRRLVQAVAAALVAGGGAIPIPLTVLAPADVVPANPVVVRSPLDGVVGRIHVRPNEPVEAGQILFDLDDTTIRGRVEVAEKALATAEAELRQLSQQALSDPSAKPKLAIALGRRDERAAELAWLRELQARIRVKAPRAGVAVLDDPSEWVGRPVAVGEKVLAIAEERDTEIEAWLSPRDAIALPGGAAVTVFLNIDPLNPVQATVRYVGYEAVVRPDGTVAHRVRAVLANGAERPRLGLKGTARLTGERVSLAYWLLRRPWVAVRQTLGL